MAHVVILTGPDPLWKPVPLWLYPLPWSTQRREPVFWQTEMKPFSCPGTWMHASLLQAAIPVSQMFCLVFMLYDCCTRNRDFFPSMAIIFGSITGGTSKQDHIEWALCCLNKMHDKCDCLLKVYVNQGLLFYLNGFKILKNSFCESAF